MSAKDQKSHKLPKVQEMQLIARWLHGESVPTLAGAFEVGERTVARILARAGLKQADRITPAPGSRRAPPGGFSGSGGQAPAQAAARPELREQFQALGDPPKDPVEAGEWLHRNLMLAARQVATDPELDRRPAERNKALVQIARAAAGVLPQATLARTIRLIKADAEERDGAGAGPEEEVKPVNGQPSGALRAPARRGRSPVR